MPAGTLSSLPDNKQRGIRTSCIPNGRSHDRGWLSHIREGRQFRSCGFKPSLLPRVWPPICMHKSLALQTQKRKVIYHPCQPAIISKLQLSCAKYTSAVGLTLDTTLPSPDRIWDWVSV